MSTKDQLAQVVAYTMIACFVVLFILGMIYVAAVMLEAIRNV